MTQDGQGCAVAFVGAGYMTREHVRAFADVPGVRLTGIHSRTRTRAEALAAELGIAGVYDSVDELYRATAADLVVVSVPELAANAVSREVFRHPWTALLEKPAGYDVADAEEIARAAAACDRHAYVALNRRFYGSTRTALDALDGSGPRLVQVLDQQDQAAALAAGRPRRVVENWMYANSIHTIDLLRVFTRGRAVGVEPIVAWTPDDPGFVVSRVDFDSGDVGLYEGIWNGPGPWGVFVSTASERWELRPLEEAAYQIRGERRLHRHAGVDWDSDFKPGLRRQAEEAIAAVRGEPTLLPTLEEALETMRLIKAIFAAAPTDLTSS